MAIRGVQEEPLEIGNMIQISKQPATSAFDPLDLDDDEDPLALPDDYQPAKPAKMASRKAKRTTRLNARQRHNLETAISLAAVGCFVIPVSEDKIPLIPEFQRADTIPDDDKRVRAVARWRSKHASEPVHVGATRNRKAIQKMWRKYPDAVPGISTGPSGIVVLDPDRKDDGPAKLNALFKAKRKRIANDVPITCTPSGGNHLFCKNSAALGCTTGGEWKKLYGTDIKGIGGMVIAPDARFANGKTYKTLQGRPSLMTAMLDDTLPEVPDWLLQEIKRCAAVKPKATNADDDTEIEAVIEQLEAEEWPNEEDVCRAYKIDRVIATEPLLVEKVKSEDHSAVRWQLARTLARQFSNMSPMELGAIYSAHSDICGTFTDCNPAPGEYDHRQIARAYVKNMADREIHASGKFGAADDDDYGFDEPPPPLVPAQSQGDEDKDETFRPFGKALRQRKLDEIPDRPIVVAGMLQRGKVSGITGPGGSSKSTFGLQLAIAIVTNRPEVACLPEGAVVEKVNVGYINAEDDEDEIERRLTAIREHHDIDFSEIEGRLHVESGVGPDGELKLTKRRQSGVLVPNEDAAERIIEAAKALDLGVIIIDPMIEYHAGLETNEEFKPFFDMLRKIAEETGAAVLLSTHTSKLPVASSEGFHGNANAQRGGTSLANAMRALLTLFAMSKKEADAYGIAEDDARQYIRLEGAKANYSAQMGGLWMKRVVIGDGPKRSVAILVPAELTKRTKGSKTVSEVAKLNGVLGEVETAARQEAKERGTLVRDVVVRSTTEFIKSTVDATGLSRATVQRHLQALVKSGDLAQVEPAEKRGPHGYRLLKASIYETAEDDDDDG